MKVLSSRYIAVLAAATLGMLALVPSAADARDEASQEQQFIELMDGYLGVSRQWVEMAGRREGVMFFAIEGIVEIYEERGELRAAIPHLERILRDHGTDGAVRVIVSFKLRDVYRKTGQEQRALEILDDVIARAAQ